VAGDGLRGGSGESAEFPTDVKEVGAMCVIVHGRRRPEERFR
jgi:hypothetical protein